MAHHTIAFENVSLAVEDTPILSGITCAFPAQGVTGILGPNGAGKSTLLRLAMGFVPPTSGTVRLDGRPMGSFSRRQIARTISFVPQDTHIEFPFTAMEIVLMGRSPHLGRLKGPGEDDREIAMEAMRRTETDGFARRPVTTLSGGERQRVFLARALATRSPFIVLDEPIANLDIEHTLRFLEMARRLCREEEKGILVAMHHLDLAARFADRILLLKRGGIAADGAPMDVLIPERIREVFHVEAQVLGEREGFLFTLSG